MPGGPPGAIAVVQRGASRRRARRRASATLGHAKRPPRPIDHMRIASVAKAFSGAVALSLVRAGRALARRHDRPRLPDLPAAGGAVTPRPAPRTTPAACRTSRRSPAFRRGRRRLASRVAPPPADLLAYRRRTSRSSFTPGTQVPYSNSDNIAVGLMVQAATGTSYEDVAAGARSRAARSAQTSLPRGPRAAGPVHPRLRRSRTPAADEDVSEILASGWAWASGGDRLDAARAEPLHPRLRRRRALRPAPSQRGAAPLRPERRSSEPPGPGVNAAGLALFRYQTALRHLYGHTGNTFGFTQFAAATRTAPVGRRSRSTSSARRRAPTGRSPCSRRCARPRSTRCAPRWRADLDRRRGGRENVPPACGSRRPWLRCRGVKRRGGMDECRIGNLGLTSGPTGRTVRRVGRPLAVAMLLAAFLGIVLAAGRVSAQGPDEDAAPRRRKSRGSRPPSGRNRSPPFPTS